MHSSFTLITCGIVAAYLCVASRAVAQLPPIGTDSLRASVSFSGIVVRAANESVARAALPVVIQIHSNICAILGVTNTPPQSVAWFSDAAAWKNYIGNSGSHLMGRGVSALGGVAILTDATDAHEPLAHEIVHQVLKGTSKAPLPLWFEEGSAACFGWMAASEFAASSGHPVSRMLPAMQETSLLSATQILKSHDYPATAEANQAFYRQSEELVRLLHEQLGAGNFRRLTVELARDNDLHACLSREFTYSEGMWRELLSAMNTRSISTQRR